MKYEKAMVKVIRLGTEDIIATSGEEHTGCGCQGWPWGNYTAHNNWGGYTYKPQQNWFQKFFGFFWRL